MRCFVHHDAEAVAVCRSCLKGACAACARPVTLGVACSDACLPVAERVGRLQLANSHNLVIARIQTLVPWLVVVIFLALGVDSLLYNMRSIIGWMAILLSVVFVVAILRAKRR